MPWTRARESAAALDAAIAAIDPDAVAGEAMQAALATDAVLAGGLASECRDLAAPEISELAACIERALRLIASGQVEPHHAQWQMAAALVTARQALDHLAAGESYAPVALAGARFELETLFPMPDGRRAGDPPGTVVPSTNLVRKLT
jgi:hypothetical protein